MTMARIGFRYAPFFLPMAFLQRAGGKIDLVSRAARHIRAYYLLVQALCAQLHLCHLDCPLTGFNSCQF